jgi:Tol biopolymer transport system component
MISGQAIEVFHGRDCSGLRWSPDGSELSFYGQGSDSTRAAFIVPRLGGKPRRLAGMESSPVWSLTGTELLHFSWEKSQFIFTDKTTGESKSISLDKSIAENIEDFDLSPSGKLIAFTTSDSEGKYSIWIITADGSRKNKIIEDTEYWLGSPRWSPRGDAIYYLQDAEEAEDIRKITVSPDSGKPAKPPSPILEGHQVGSCFTLTNDGTQLFYERGPSIVNIWQATLEGSEKGQKVDVKQLTTGTSVHQSPSLSPDGKLVAYATATGYSANIYVMPAGGGPSQQITFFNSWCASPVWSPDGKEIAFFSNQGGSYKIWKVSAAGGQPHQFAKSEGAYWPIWAPGQKILYRSSKNNNLWFIDPATEAETSLFKINPTDYIMWPKYSPDGKKIVVLWQKESGKEPGLWLISLDDSSSVMLRKGRAFPIGWSADGKWIYASERGAGRLEILAISSETGQSKPWLSLPPNPEMGQIITMFCSAADGTHFVFSARKSQPDIWLIENFDPEIK